MYINLRNLEAINELPLQRTMLNQNQLRRLEAIDRWLIEIRDSEEFKQLEYSPDVMLGDAIQAVGELLDEHEPCDYKPTNFTDSEWHKYLEQKPVMHIRRVKNWRKKINSFIQDGASEGEHPSFYSSNKDKKNVRCSRNNHSARYLPEQP